MTGIDALEHSVSALMTKCVDLQADNANLRTTIEQQRQEILRTHAELVELQQRYRHLQVAHGISATPEDRDRARQQINLLIQRVDRAIDVLRQ